VVTLHLLLDCGIGDITIILSFHRILLSHCTPHCQRCVLHSLGKNLGGQLLPKVCNGEVVLLTDEQDSFMNGMPCDKCIRTLISNRKAVQVVRTFIVFLFRIIRSWWFLAKHRCAPEVITQILHLHRIVEMKVINKELLLCPKQPNAELPAEVPGWSVNGLE